MVQLVVLEHLDKVMQVVLILVLIYKQLVAVVELVHQVVLQLNRQVQVVMVPHLISQEVQ